MHGIEFSGGPHFDRDLIGPNGRLMRLHKGKSRAPDPPPIAPAARRPLDDQSLAAADQRDHERNKRGYMRSLIAQHAQDRAGTAQGDKAANLLAKLGG